MSKMLKIIKLLWKGNGTKVYLVKNWIDQNNYALKEVKIIKNNDFKVYFKEIQNLCKFNHNNVIKYIFSWFSYQNDFKNITKNNKYNYIYILMEYCELTLEDYINNRNYKIFKEHFNFNSKILNNNELLFIFRIIGQIYNGIKYIHNKGCIHRDIKPSNIFLKIINDKYFIKIADFGISKFLDFNENESVDTVIKPLNLNNKSLKHNSLNDVNKKDKIIWFQTFLSNRNIIINKSTELTSNVGTYLYMSPEQKDSNNYDFRSDLYSLGITLFLLLYPFKTNFEKFIEIKNLKENKYNDELSKIFPNIYKLLLDLTKEKDKRPTLKLIKETINNEILKKLFKLNNLNVIRIYIKSESKINFKPMILGINKNNNINLKKDLYSFTCKISKKITLNDYNIVYDYNKINLISKKHKNYNIKMDKVENIKILYNLINYIK